MINDNERAKTVAKSESGGLLSLTELSLVFDVGRDFVKAMARERRLTMRVSGGGPRAPDM